MLWLAHAHFQRYCDASVDFPTASKDQAMKPARFLPAMLLVFALPAQAQYGLNAPAAFTAASVGEETGFGISLYSVDNSYKSGLHVREFQSGIAPDVQTDVYTVTEGNAGEARARSGFGQIHLYTAMTDYADTGINLHAGAIADAGWMDDVLIDHPLFHGTRGILSFGLKVHGLLAAQKPQGGALLTLGAWGAEVTEPYLWNIGASPLKDEDLGIDTTAVFHVPFTFGTEFVLKVRGLAAVRLSGLPPIYGRGSAAEIDFENSAYWSGIQGVTAGGAAVTDYSISAGSGTDYRQSFVPEPSGALALVIGGMLTLAARVRRTC